MINYVLNVSSCDSLSVSPLHICTESEILPPDTQHIIRCGPLQTMTYKRVVAACPLFLVSRYLYKALHDTISPFPCIVLQYINGYLFTTLTDAIVLEVPVVVIVSSSTNALSFSMYRAVKKKNKAPRTCTKIVTNSAYCKLRNSTISL